MSRRRKIIPLFGALKEALSLAMRMLYYAIYAYTCSICVNHHLTFQNQYSAHNITSLKPHRLWLSGGAWVCGESCVSWSCRSAGCGKCSPGLWFLLSWNQHHNYTNDIKSYNGTSIQGTPMGLRQASLECLQLYHYIAVRVITPKGPKKIINVDFFYLLKCTIFFYRF